MSTNARPAFSICVPIYNTAAWLPECLDSILSQSFENFELLCVNDGSTDCSREILNNYARRDCRIHVWHSKHKGQSKARNFMLKQGRGSYIWFVDSDDRLVDDALKTLYEKLKNENLELLFIQIKPFSEDRAYAKLVKKRTPYYYLKGDYGGLYDGTSLVERLVENNDYRTSTYSTIFARPFLEKYQFRFGNYNKYEDNVFVYQICILTKRAAVLKKTVYERRFRKNSLMTENISYTDISTLFKCYVDMLAFAHEHNLGRYHNIKLLYPLVHLKYYAQSLYQGLNKNEQKKAIKACSGNQVLLYTDFLPYNLGKKDKKKDFLQKVWHFLSGK